LITRTTRNPSAIRRSIVMPTSVPAANPRGRQQRRHVRQILDRPARRKHPDGHLHKAEQRRKEPAPWDHQNHPQRPDRNVGDPGGEEKQRRVPRHR